MALPAFAPGLPYANGTTIFRPFAVGRYARHNGLAAGGWSPLARRSAEYRLLGEWPNGRLCSWSAAVASAIISASVARWRPRGGVARLRVPLPGWFRFLASLACPAVSLAACRRRPGVALAAPPPCRPVRSGRLSRLKRRLSRPPLPGRFPFARLLTPVWLLVPWVVPVWSPILPKGILSCS